MQRMTRRSEIGLLAAIIALAAFLRLYRLDGLPPGDGHDVAQYGVDALQILGGARPIFLASNFGREVLFSYLVALAYLFVGPGAYGIHLVSALAGIATVPAIYLAARALFHDARDGVLAYLPLLSALLAAVSYWHLNWSRVGLRVILVPLFAALVIFALWRGFATGRRLWFGAAGVLLGLSLYTYQAARLLPVLVAIAFVLHGLSRRWSRADTINLLLTAALAALVFAPLGVYALRHPGALSERIQQAAVLQPDQPLGEQIGPLASQAVTALLTYSFRGDTDPQFTIAGRPSLNPFLSIGLLAGILIALWRFRRSPYLFLLAWLALMTAPAMIADQAATAKRYLGAFPAVIILIALGLLLPPALMRRRAAGGGPQTTDGRMRLASLFYILLLAGGLLYSAGATWRDYFIVWAADPDLPAHFQVDYRAIGQAIASLDREQPVWVSPHAPDHPVIQLHAGLRPELRGYNGRFCVPFADPSGPQGATYVIVPGLQDQSLEWLKALFPTGKTIDGPMRPGSDRPYYQTFVVPPNEPAAMAARAGAPQSWNEEIELLAYELNTTDFRAGGSLAVTATYRAIRDGTADYTAFVHLLGPPRPADGSPLWAQSDSQPCGGSLPTSRWRTGDIIRETVVLQVPTELPAGTYQVVTGFYTWPDLVRLTVDKTGSDAITLGTAQVPSR